MAPASSTRSAQFPTSSSKPVSNVSNTKKSEPAASTSGSSMSTARNRDMACHTCGGKGHFKRDCPNRKVMFINEDNEYETGDDVDPYAPEDDDYDSDGVDAYPSEARTIVVPAYVEPAGAGAGDAGLGAGPSGENRARGRTSTRQNVRSYWNVPGAPRHAYADRPVPQPLPSDQTPARRGKWCSTFSSKWGRGSPFTFLFH
ncbi:hypothetical protein QYE76_037208 [Lolium multiflorum]|uniref:CCHC-type domain-containing protein n=1 Tax=Lolium multiflorum TaxID=4521 RepID=A0AAD8V2B1_LOLMU|nr:hypothetical protein QYE76_037208 [Lolium multiflorum]